MGLIGDIAGIFTSGRAAGAISNANIAAEHGVIDSTNAGVTGIGSAVGAGVNQVGQAGANVNQAAVEANAGLGAQAGTISGNAQPYIQAGQQGISSLADYAASKPQFNFNPGDLKNDPGYQFELAQGQDAITNRASASGLAAGGNVMKDLASYGQGLAATHYNDAFNRAKSTFDTNQSATLSNLSTLANAGLAGNQQVISGTNPLALQQSGNTTGAAGTNASLQSYLAGLQVQGATAQGNLGQQGAVDAGNFAVGAGNARSTGILGTGAAIGKGIGDLGSLIAGIPGVGTTAGGILKGLG